MALVVLLYGLSAVFTDGLLTSFRNESTLHRLAIG